MLESKLTGRGRLYNNAVEAIIQQFAREGALPTYEQLSKINNDYFEARTTLLSNVEYSIKDDGSFQLYESSLIYLIRELYMMSNHVAGYIAKKLVMHLVIAVEVNSWL